MKRQPVQPAGVPTFIGIDYHKAYSVYCVLDAHGSNLERGRIDHARPEDFRQRAVNRGENYHQLRRAVSYANFGKLRFRTEYEQLLWSECSRLIANCIIYYNATILSHLLAHKENTGDKYGADLVKEASPVAWQHINLYGRYEFREQPAPVDVEEIVRELADIQIETDSTPAA